MQIKAVIFVSVLFVFLCNVRISGQKNYFTKTFTTENGLPHNHVRSIAQDSTGFLWIATWDGLSRYDGYELKNYYHNPTDSTSLAYFICDNVLVDYENNVWISGSGGISKYKRKSDNFLQFEYKYVGGIALDNEGKLWCNTYKGLQRWDYKLNEFKTVKVKSDALKIDSETLSPGSIIFDNEDQLWILTTENDKRLIYRCTKNDFENYNADFIGTFYSRYYQVFNNATFKFEIVVAPENDYRIFCAYGVFRFESRIKEFLPANENPDTIKNWIIREAYSRQENYHSEVTRKKGNSQTLPHFVETYYVDKQNTLWQGILTPASTQTGLTHVVKTPSGFKHYFTGLNPESGLNAIFPVLKDKNGSVWGGVTNMNRIFLHNPDGEEKQLIPLKEETWKLAQRPRALVEDSTGVWIGYFQRLLAYYDYNTSKFSEVILKKTEMEERNLPHSFVHLKKIGDELLIVGFKEIFKYNIKTKTIIPLKLIEHGIDFNLYCITRDTDNTWWLGSSLGRIFHYDEHFNEIAVYTVAKGLFNVEDIVVGDNNDLWISMLGAGLGHFDKESGKSKIYTTADGLANNTCYGMQKDKNGNLWISTNHGISRFNPKTEKFRIFGPEDGLKIDEFNSDNTYLAPDGEMFFAGMGGIVSFYPDSIGADIHNESASRLIIADFKVSGANRYFKKAIYDTDSVKLEKGDNNFKITFTCLDFVNASKIKYRYRLANKDKVFTETDFRNRSVNYANLSPGKYKFEVEATNVNGDWISKTGLFIEIPPFFYQTWLFRFLLFLIVAGTIVYFVFTYNRQLRLKARQQQDELKLESLRGQMNPHFIFNSLNSINYFISQNDRLAANRYIADFARLIRSILSNLSQEYISLAKELESINDYLQLEHLRFSDKFNYEILVDEVISPEDFLVFPGMVQPFIENAIWHGVRGLEGRKGFVKIRFFTENPGSLCCVVEDDGIGRKQSEAHKSTLPGKTSRGIGIVLERLRIINHLRNTNFKVTIEDLYSDRKESGTRVRVDIPVK
jgi:ligand-binding sensor domain-containing protein